jgi:hypothetical protein
MSVVELELPDSFSQSHLVKQLPPKLEGIVGPAEWTKISNGLCTHFRKWGPRDISLTEWLVRFIACYFCSVAIVCAVAVLFSAGDRLSHVTSMMVADPLQIRQWGAGCIVILAGLVVFGISFMAGTYCCNMIYGSMIVAFDAETRARRLREFFYSFKDCRVEVETRVNRIGHGFEFVHVLKFAKAEK